MAKRFDIHTTDFGWNRATPVVRMAVWFALVAAVGGIAQAVVWIGGGDVSMVSPKGGRTVLLLAALGFGAFIMSRTGWGLADYGLAVSERWLLHLLAGLVLGAGFVAGLVAVAMAAGAVVWRETFEFTGVWGALAEALPAMPIASVCVVMLAGFAVGELRQRHGRLTTAAVIAAMAGLAFGVTILEGGWSPADGRIILTAALVGGVLALMRMLTGDVVLALGTLMGGLGTERLLRKAGMLAGQDSGWSAWLAPDGNVRLAPAAWVVLGLAVALLIVLVLRRPADVVAQRQSKGLSRSFKRTYPMGTMGALAPLDVWIAQLRQARFRVGLVYIPRLIATLVLSTINTVLSLPERLILPRVYRGFDVKPPVFVLGVHRSGTTHLQNLLALDPALITPRAHQVMNPWGFRYSGLLLWPILIIGTPWKRPMDAVRFGLSSANEEEYAIANLCGQSPDWSIRLPERWDEYDRFCDPAGFTHAERANWKRMLHGFLQRLVARSGRRPMLKNPYNTGRVALLRELYPEAMFIHIHRHPFDTYRSNQHMSEQAHCLFELQECVGRERFSAWFLEHYRASEERFYADTADLPTDRVVEVRFEDLEADARAQVQRIYQTLGLDYTDAFDAALRDYLGDLTGYKKNVHKTLPPEEAGRVTASMGRLMQRWGYGDRAEQQDSKTAEHSEAP